MIKRQEVQKRQERLNNSGVYECYVCYNRLISPAKCLNCKKMLCGTHIFKIKNKCPNCRADPFKFEKDEILSSVLQEITKEEWEILDKDLAHKCMIAGC